ncbi:MAG: UDP-N-acetylmuramate dehydrogenase [Lactovum sp.]
MDKILFENIKTEILYNEPLSNYTYTKVGGPADFLAFPENSKALIELISYAKKKNIEITVLGNASNLIVRDAGIQGLVILLDKMDKVAVEGNEIIAEAGAKLKEVTKIAQANSLSHFEFAAGIPGSIGGAVFMNAGAYGGEIKDIFKSAKVLDIDRGKIIDLIYSDLDFSYRYSKLSKENWILLSACFVLEKGDKEQIQAKMDNLNQQRADIQPLEYPSCGSVFKRPEGYFTGQLIREAGCVGHRIGGVEVSKKHAGFMVNIAQGKAQDYEDLIKYVTEKVKENSGINLFVEVRIIGKK